MDKWKSVCAGPLGIFQMLTFFLILVSIISIFSIFIVIPTPFILIFIAFILIFITFFVVVRAWLKKAMTAIKFSAHEDVSIFSKHIFFMRSHTFSKRVYQSVGWSVFSVCHSVTSVAVWNTSRSTQEKHQWFKLCSTCSDSMYDASRSRDFRGPRSRQ